MPKFYNKDIAELTLQLTMSPRRLRWEQIHGIELLLELVEEDRAYPFDFVCFRITDYRKRRTDASGPSIPGKALIADLITMAESLSRKANLSVTEMDEPFLTHQEVADQLDVSTKTIRRWRNRGLLGIRLVFDDGVNRLAFCKSTVQRWVVRNRDLVQKGAAFKQLSEEERMNIVGRAGELLIERPLKLHAAAKLIAAETGRAVETVRYTLRRYDESASRPLFADGRDHAICDRYQSVWNCHELGESPATIARAFSCDTNEVHRIIRYVRVHHWKLLKLDFVANELFDAPGADDLILDIAEPPVSDARPAKPPKDTPAYLQALYLTPLLTREQEYDLFRRYNYRKACTRKMIDKLNPDEATPDDVSTIETSMKQIDLLRQRIISANLRLVVSIAKKHVGWSPQFFEVISDGNISLMRAVEKFDFDRGVKFSTYATWAVMKNYARSIPEQHYRSARFVTGQDELLDSTADPREAPPSDSDRQRVREMIAAGMESLDEREREIVKGHFGLGCDGGALTLEQLGRRFGVTKERIRQIEHRALARLRDALSPSLADTIPT